MAHYKKYCVLSLFHLYKGRHNGCCLTYIGNTSNRDSNHYGGHCIHNFRFRNNNLKFLNKVSPAKKRLPDLQMIQLSKIVKDELSLQFLPGSLVWGKVSVDHCMVSH